MLSINIDSSLLAALLIATGAYAAWNCILKSRLIKKKPFADLPMPEGNDALKGHMSLLAKASSPGMPEVVSDYADARGRTGLWIASKPAIALTHWEDVRAILQAESNRVGSPIQRKLLGKLVGENSILLLNGREWKMHRAAINKAFTPAALKSYRDAMEQVTRTVVASIEKRIVEQGRYKCEMEPLMKLITLDVFGLAAFSYDFGCCSTLATSELAASFDALVKDLDFRVKNNPIKPAHYFYGLPTERNRKHKQALDAVRSFVTQCMKERASMKKKPNDLLTYLMETTGEAGFDGTISNDILDDVIITVLFAGYDTTSITLTYALYALSQNPEIERKCVAEIKSVGSIASLEDLSYCKAVVQETLRYYPPAATTARTLVKPVKLPDGFVIPEETYIIIPIWAIHHNEMNFPRPNEFLPERWATEDATNNSSRWVDRDPSTTDAVSISASSSCSSSCIIPAGNPKAFFAFSGGGRSCPGQRFAINEAVIAMAGLVEAFHFSTLPGYVLQPTRQVPIQHPHDQLPMIITKRC